MQKIAFAKTAATDEALRADSEKAAELFNKQMADMFPDFWALSRNSQNLGAAQGFTFICLKDPKDSPQGIIQNAPGYMSLMMSLSDSRGNSLKLGDKVDIELLTWDYHLKKYQFQFRKISGKSPQEATKKLLAWFQKNQQALFYFANEVSKK